MKKLTQKQLKKILKYDSETGQFVRRITTGRRRAKKGDIAGSINKDGYQVICVNSKSYYAHRLAWLYVYGCFPEHGLDHKDQDSSNNAIHNLREASKQCNARNYGNCAINTSGVKGVSWDKFNQKWQACIMVNNKTKKIGRYSNFDDAACARLAAEQCVNWSGCDSSSPAYQYVKTNISPAWMMY